VLGKTTYERLPEERKEQARENLGTLRAQLLGAGFPPLGGASHAMQEENPGALNDAILGFLARHATQ
jgi:hypothetical protein